MRGDPALGAGAGGWAGFLAASHGDRGRSRVRQPGSCGTERGGSAAGEEP